MDKEMNEETFPHDFEGFERRFGAESARKVEHHANAMGTSPDVLVDKLRDAFVHLSGTMEDVAERFLKAMKVAFKPLAENSKKQSTKPIRYQRPMAMTRPQGKNRHAR